MEIKYRALIKKENIVVDVHTINVTTGAIFTNHPGTWKHNYAADEIILLEGLLNPLTQEFLYVGDTIRYQNSGHLKQKKFKNFDELYNFITKSIPRGVVDLGSFKICKK